MSGGVDEPFVAAIRMLRDVTQQDAGRVLELRIGKIVKVSNIVAASLIAKGFAVADEEGTDA